MRNAVDCESAEALVAAFREFAADDESSVAVLYGEGGTFCAGADLKAIAAGRGNRTEAARTLEQALSFDPGNADARKLLNELPP